MGNNGKGKSDQSRPPLVIEVDAGRYLVESASGRTAYKAILDNGRSVCTCNDYIHHAKSKPNYRCKHLTMIKDRLEAGDHFPSVKANCRRNVIKPEFIETIDGQDFVTYRGLLDLAHQAGLIRIEVNVLQYPTADNDQTAIVQAEAETETGRLFIDVGDANPANCNARVSRHLIRMASTRAKARALRDLTNVGMTALEELGGSVEALTGHGTRPYYPPSKQEDAGKDEPGNGRNGKQVTAKASTAQHKAIKNLAGRRGLGEDELASKSQEMFGVALEALTSANASALISDLQQAA